MTQLRTQLLLVANSYAKARGISRARVSTIVFNAGSTLDKIANGRDLTTGSFEKAMLWFSANWPEGAKWPKSIARPKVEAA